MSLPQAVLDFLNENAQSEGNPAPGPNDDLFKDGALDSFALIDFVTLLEEHTGIKVPDKDVNPGNFQTLDAVERYIETHKG